MCVFLLQIDELSVVVLFIVVLRACIIYSLSVFHSQVLRDALRLTFSSFTN